MHGIFLVFILCIAAFSVLILFFVAHSEHAYSEQEKKIQKNKIDRLMNKYKQEAKK